MKISPRVLDLIAREDIGDVRRNELLCKHSNWRIGGPADLLVEPRDAEQVGRILQLAKDAAIPVVVIGDGTNLLFNDTGVRGMVMKISRNMSQFSVTGQRIHAQAGTWVPRLIRVAGCGGLTGIEHAIGIPGTLGGLILMNGGSMRRGIGENVRSVCVVDQTGKDRTLSRAECLFSYRHSSIQGSGGVVVAAELECDLGDPSRIRTEMLRIMRSRRHKFPQKLPNCGSVFISGGEMYEKFGPPGKIIEELGMKGMRCGGAQISEIHANFFVNLGQATAAEMLLLIQQARTAAYTRTHIWMDCEVRYVSPHGQIVPAHEAGKYS